MLDNISDVIKIILLVAVIVMIVAIICMLVQLFLYIRDKRVQIDFLDALELDKNNEFVSLGLAIEDTSQLLLFINTIIDNEIGKFLIQYQKLNTRYDLKKTDDDIKTIATSVTNAFKEEIIIDDECVLTEEYLIRHILNEVTVRFINAVQNMNYTLIEIK